MKVAEKIGEYKKRNNISIFQPKRWSEILDKAVAKGNVQGLSEHFVTAFLKAIHDESINKQEEIMNDQLAGH